MTCTILNASLRKLGKCERVFLHGLSSWLELGFSLHFCHPQPLIYQRHPTWQPKPLDFVILVKPPTNGVIETLGRQPMSGFNLPDYRGRQPEHGGQAGPITCQGPYLFSNIILAPGICMQKVGPMQLASTHKLNCTDLVTLVIYAAPRIFLTIKLYRNVLK